MAAPNTTDIDITDSNVDNVDMVKAIDDKLRHIIDFQSDTRFVAIMDRMDAEMGGLNAAIDAAPGNMLERYMTMPQRLSEIETRMYAGMMQLNASHKQEAAEAAEMLEAGQAADKISTVKYEETIKILARIEETLEKRGNLHVERLCGGRRSLLAALSLVAPPSSALLDGVGVLQLQELAEFGLEAVDLWTRCRRAVGPRCAVGTHRPAVQPIEHRSPVRVLDEHAAQGHHKVHVVGACWFLDMATRSVRIAATLGIILPSSTKRPSGGRRGRGPYAVTLRWSFCKSNESCNAQTQSLGHSFSGQRKTELPFPCSTKTIALH